MKDVYREVAPWRRLLPRERDPVTGRLDALRDDKGRRDQQSSRSTGRSVVSGGFVAAVVAAVVAVGGGVVGVRALVTSDEPARSTPTAVVAPPTPTTSEAAATAIDLEYTGGQLVRHECTDPSGGDACTYFEETYSPLAVRCTPDSCTASLSFVHGAIDGPLHVEGSTPPLTDGCQPTRWVMDLTPIGQTVTEGIRHPARIVGTVTVSRPAENVGSDTSCLGAHDEYRYDATPS